MMDLQKVKEVYEFLLGSSSTEQQAAEACGVDDEVILDYITAAKVECCSECGWWYDADELNEIQAELICNDCNNKE
jgi:hypothetical protein